MVSERRGPRARSGGTQGRQFGQGTGEETTKAEGAAGGKREEPGRMGKRAPGGGAQRNGATRGWGLRGRGLERADLRGAGRTQGGSRVKAHSPGTVPKGVPGLASRKVN